MNQIAIKDLSALRAAVQQSGLKLAAAPAISARRGKKQEEAKPSIPGLGKKPALPTSMNVEEMTGQLVAVIDGAFAGRGLAASMALADHALACLSEAELRKGNGVSPEKSVVRAIEAIVNQAGVHARGAYQPATRGRRLLQMLEDCPGVSEGKLVKIDRAGGLVEVENAREAVSALALFEQMVGAEVDRQFLSDLEVAKSTKLDSLRSPVLRRMRKVTPDFGAALVAASLAQKGFTKTGLPNPNFVWMSFNGLNWSVAVLADLREVLSDDNEESRGWLFLPHLSEETALDYEQYGQLVEKIQQIRPGNNASAAVRAQAQERYEADKAEYDELLAQWNRIQAEIEEVQQEAINVVDGVLSFFRHKIAEKEWLIANDKASRGHKPEAGQEQEASAPKVVAPAPRTKKQSTHTPKEAVQELLKGGMEVETEISLPVINHAALGIAQVEIKKSFAADGVDGARECSAYPGVVWEPVIGPIHHAMDLNCEEPDCRLLVIAPRRVGGMGLELTAARVLMLAEYEDFFTPVEE